MLIKHLHFLDFYCYSLLTSIYTVIGDSMKQSKLDFKAKKKDSPSTGKKKGKKKNPWSDSSDGSGGDSASEDDIISTPTARTVSRRAAAGNILNITLLMFY